MYYPLFTTYVLIPYLAYTDFPLVFDKLEIQIEVNLIYYYDNLSENLIVKNLADIWEYILKKDVNTTYIYIYIALSLLKKQTINNDYHV